MLQLHHLLALSLSLVLCLHVSSMPISTTTSSIPAATTISSPSQTTTTISSAAVPGAVTTPEPKLTVSLLESSCIRDEVDVALERLFWLHLQDLQFPSCSDLTSNQPFWNMYFGLERSVELLESTNADHTDLVCRFRSTVLPFLNRTLTGWCNSNPCHGREEARSEVLSFTLGPDDSTEFCVVRSVRKTLGMLLSNLPLIRSDVARGDLQCTVTFTERQQIRNITQRVMDLENDTEICELPTDISHACVFPTHLAMLEEVTALLINETDDLVTEGLVEDLEAAIRYFRHFLLQDINCPHQQINTDASAINCYIAKLFRKLALDPNQMNLLNGCTEGATAQEVSTDSGNPTLPRLSPTRSSLFPQQS